MYRFLQLPALLLAARALAAPINNVPSALQNILANTDRSSLYTYPTDLTRGIIPVGSGHQCLTTDQANTCRQKAFHSHNDYWRDVPFYSAIASGAISVESDVWLINGTLHVRSIRELNLATEDD
jgi:hypothetical protein